MLDILKYLKDKGFTNISLDWDNPYYESVINFKSSCKKYYYSIATDGNNCMLDTIYSNNYVKNPAKSNIKDIKNIICYLLANNKLKRKKYNLDLLEVSPAIEKNKFIFHFANDKIIDSNDLYYILQFKIDISKEKISINDFAFNHYGLVTDNYNILPFIFLDLIEIIEKSVEIINGKKDISENKSEYYLKVIKNQIKIHNRNQKKSKCFIKV